MKVAADSLPPSSSTPGSVGGERDEGLVASSDASSEFSALCTWAGTRVEAGCAPGPSRDASPPAAETPAEGLVFVEHAGILDHVVQPERRPELVNVAFVPSPSALLPDVDFLPPEPRPPRLHGGILRRWPGRRLLLVAIALLSVPLLWIPLLGSLSSSDDAVPAAADEAAPVELILHSDGVVMRGSVPDQETADRLAARLGAALGDDRVTNDLVVDPDAPTDLDAPTSLRLDETVRFDFGRSNLVGRYQPLVTVAADLLRVTSETRLEVVGHTDDVGDADENLDLSVRRAEAVRDAVIDRGVAEERVSVAGFGETQPTADNATEEGRADNRRVEFFIFGLQD